MKNTKLSYENAEIEVIFFSTEDVITTSGEMSNDFMNGSWTTSTDNSGWDSNGSTSW